MAFGIPAPVLEVIKRLKEEGHQAYLERAVCPGHAPGLEPKD